MVKIPFVLGGSGGEQRVAVVGSGPSGLAAAFHLERSGCQVDLIEREPVLGGRFGVGKLGDRPVMMGGKNIGKLYTSFRGFTASLGRPPWEPFGINASRVKDDRVYTLDSSRRGRSAMNFLRSGHPRDVARFASLLLRVRRDERNKFLGSPYFSELARRSDHAPLSGHFGPYMTKYLLRPMVIRMNGAEPDEVYLGTFGTNLALLMDTYDQLTGSIQPVLERFSERVNVRLGTQVEGLVTRSGTVTGLRTSVDGGESEEQGYDGVVLATPAYATAAILRSTHAELSGRLEEVRYFPSTVVLVEYDRPVFTPEVRSLSMDDGPCTNAGSYGMNDRYIVRYTFSGSHARTPDPPEAQIAAWVDEAEAKLARYVPGAGRALRVRDVTKHWPAAYSAYLPFHGEFLANVRRAVAGQPGLELAGDYIRGVSIEACFRSGTDAGVALASSLGAGRPAPVADEPTMAEVAP
jgi:oxygen-dependent protoporphyrinogen oxidase